MTAAPFTVPADVTFEQAIALTQDFLQQYQSWSPEAIKGFVAELTASLNGARGFFVTYLTAEDTLADEQQGAVLAGLKVHPETVDDLMTRNLAMSTAMALTHQRSGDAAMAESSQTVSRRSREHLQALMSPALQQRLRDLQLSLGEAGHPYSDFLNRWGYDDEQRRAIAQMVEQFLPISQG